MVEEDPLEKACKWWSPVNQGWGYTGCKPARISEDGLFYICECNHLTSFGVLLGGTSNGGTGNGGGNGGGNGNGNGNGGTGGNGGGSNYNGGDPSNFGRDWSVEMILSPIFVGSCFLVVAIIVAMYNFVAPFRNIVSGTFVYTTARKKEALRAMMVQEELKNLSSPTGESITFDTV